MSIADLLADLENALSQRAYFTRLEVIDQTITLLKARLYISTDLFVQVYRNNRFDTTNLVLIHNGQQLYARDQLNGKWHRHLPSHSDQHDTTAEGSRPVNLNEFLNEVESVLAQFDLP